MPFTSMRKIRFHIFSRNDFFVDNSNTLVILMAASAAGGPACVSRIFYRSVRDA